MIISKNTAVHHTPLGILYLGAAPRGLFYAGFSEKELRKAAAAFDSAGTQAAEKSAAIIAKAKAGVDLYFAGETSVLPTVPVVLSGTGFQVNVWRFLRRLSFGQTATYAECATAIGAPGAARAVGSACGANRLLLFVPCHRMVAAGGKPGGFSAGRKRKIQLLRHEGFAPARR